MENLINDDLHPSFSDDEYDNEYTWEQSKP